MRGTAHRNTLHDAHAACSVQQYVNQLKSQAANAGGKAARAAAAVPNPKVRRAINTSPIHAMCMRVLDATIHAAPEQGSRLLWLCNGCAMQCSAPLGSAMHGTQDKKKAEEERQKELNALFAVAIKQPKVPPGVRSGITHAAYGSDVTPDALHQPCSWFR
jgi:hypothetical protein